MEWAIDDDEEVMIICRNRPSTTDAQIVSEPALLVGHVKRIYTHCCWTNSSIKTIRSKIINNLSIP